MGVVIRGVVIRGVATRPYKNGSKGCNNSDVSIYNVDIGDVLSRCVAIRGVVIRGVSKRGAANIE